MKTSISVLFFVATALILTSCKDMNSVVTPPVTNQADEMVVPWRGSMEGVAVTFGTPCGTNTRPKKFTGSGNSTHLGNCTADFKYCIMYTSQTGGIIINSGIKGIYTAANGDELWMNLVSGSFQITEWIEPPYICRVEGTINGVLDGGTGRFANATGSGVCSAMQTVDSRLSEVPTVLDWTGEISY